MSARMKADQVAMELMLEDQAKSGDEGASRKKKSAKKKGTKLRLRSADQDVDATGSADVSSLTGSDHSNASNRSSRDDVLVDRGPPIAAAIGSLRDAKGVYEDAEHAVLSPQVSAERDRAKPSAGSQVETDTQQSDRRETQRENAPAPAVAADDEASAWEVVPSRKEKRVARYSKGPPESSIASDVNATRQCLASGIEASPATVAAPEPTLADTSLGSSSGAASVGAAVNASVTPSAAMALAVSPAVQSAGSLGMQCQAAPPTAPIRHAAAASVAATGPPLPAARRGWESVKGDHSKSERDSAATSGQTSSGGQQKVAWSQPTAAPPGSQPPSKQPLTNSPESAGMLGNQPSRSAATGRAANAWAGDSSSGEGTSSASHWPALDNVPRKEFADADAGPAPTDAVAVAAAATAAAAVSAVSAAATNTSTASGISGAQAGALSAITPSAAAPSGPKAIVPKAAFSWAEKLKKSITGDKDLKSPAPGAAKGYTVLGGTSTQLSALSSSASQTLSTAGSTASPAGLAAATSPASLAIASAKTSASEATTPRAGPATTSDTCLPREASTEASDPTSSAVALSVGASPDLEDSCLRRSSTSGTQTSPPASPARTGPSLARAAADGDAQLTQGVQLPPSLPPSSESHVEAGQLPAHGESCQRSDGSHPMGSSAADIAIRNDEKSLASSTSGESVPASSSVPNTPSKPPRGPAWAAGEPRMASVTAPPPGQAAPVASYSQAASANLAPPRPSSAPPPQSLPAVPAPVPVPIAGPVQQLPTSQQVPPQLQPPPQPLLKQQQIRHPQQHPQHMQHPQQPPPQFQHHQQFQPHPHPHANRYAPANHMQMQMQVRSCDSTPAIYSHAAPQLIDGFPSLCSQLGQHVSLPPSMASGGGGYAFAPGMHYDGRGGEFGGERIPHPNQLVSSEAYAGSSADGDLVPHEAGRAFEVWAAATEMPTKKQARSGSSSSNSSSSSANAGGNSVANNRGVAGSTKSRGDEAVRAQHTHGPRAQQQQHLGGRMSGGYPVVGNVRQLALMQPAGNGQLGGAMPGHHSMPHVERNRTGNGGGRPPSCSSCGGGMGHSQGMMHQQSPHHLGPVKQQQSSRLHDEIMKFANENLQQGSSRTDIHAIKSSLHAVVSKRWPGATVELYGSRSTGLYLSTSDMDVVLMGVPCSAKDVGECLTVLRDDLVEQPWVSGHTLVLGARIPVLKLHSLNSVPVDITIASSPQHTGLQARDLLVSYLADSPQLAPLVVVFKTFLRDLGLNDPYTGGLSSYCLVVLLYNFWRESLQFGFSTTDCGYLLYGDTPPVTWEREQHGEALAASAHDRHAHAPW